MLTSKQRGYLSSLAASLHPTVMIGKEGATEGVLRALDAEFAHRELVKLRFVDGKDEAPETARELARRTGSELVRVIGFVAVFYKQAAEAERRLIQLPS
jgi:RNA-binding protein